MAGIIRRQTFRSQPAFSFEDLDGQRRAILAAAHAQARQIIADAERQARQRAAAIVAAARPQGLAEGRQAGLEQARREAAETAVQEARAELTRLGAALSSALEQFNESKRCLLARAESGLLELALAIARRVCRHEVGRSSETARANARALLEMVQHEADLELHLHPRDCETLRAALPELLGAIGRTPHVTLVPDQAVEQGGCVLHTRHGTIDARLETQLDRIAAALVGAGAPT